MIRRSFDAILLDVDGTLVDDHGRIPPRTRERLLALQERGVRIMITTGRSEIAALEVFEQLPVETPAVVYNGAAVYCPASGRLLEERTLADEVVERSLALAESRGWLLALMRRGEKFARRPVDEAGAHALTGLTGLKMVDDGDMPTERMIRVTFYSSAHEHSGELAIEVAAAIPRPAYLTHFPLAALARHRGSAFQVVDLHPPCRGKAEALRVLDERYGIPRERVVAVGDAANDLPMLEAAGLAVAMGNAFPDVLDRADRVIGDNNTDTIADLVDELFGA